MHADIVLELVTQAAAPRPVLPNGPRNARRRRVSALLGATQRGWGAGPMVRLQELLQTSGQFASALETVRGREIAARLSALGRQVEVVTRKVEEAAEDLGTAVGVLPPHRTPVPQARPRLAVDATPPALRPGARTAARHR